MLITRSVLNDGKLLRRRAIIVNIDGPWTVWWRWSIMIAKWWWPVWCWWWWTIWRWCWWRPIATWRRSIARRWWTVFTRHWWSIFNRRWTIVTSWWTIRITRLRWYTVIFKVVSYFNKGIMIFIWLKRRKELQKSHEFLKNKKLTLTI